MTTLPSGPVGLVVMVGPSAPRSVKVTPGTGSVLSLSRLLMTRLGLVNTLSVYWLPSIFSAYYMLLCASYIQNLPEALFEAARVDGASELRIFTQFIIPLSVPMLACISIYVGVGHWNSWFEPMIYLQKNTDLYPLQLLLRNMFTNSNLGYNVNSGMQVDAANQQTTTSLRMVVTMIGTVPILCVYPFLQKYFTSGVYMGAVKG